MPTANRQRRRAARTAAATALAGLTIAGLAGCGLQPATAYVPEVGPGSIEPIEGLPEDAAITMTAKNFTEQLILGKIGVITAKAAGFDVTDLTNVPGSVPVRQLMLDGGADVTWEYTGTAWLTYLGEETGIPDKQEQFDAVKEADAELGLTWLEPAPLNNTYALAIRSEAAEELGVSKLSDIADLPVEERTICVEPEFNSRADGLNPMLETYGIPRGSADGVPDENVAIYDTGAVYTATDKGAACNFGEVFTTDGRIDSLDLTVLEDDESFFPAYNVSAVFHTATLDEYPGLADVFAQVTPALDDETMRQLNLRVDEGGEEPADVAYDFMLEQGFITEP
ncbi:glycine betaine ABC transporter substrate-binding protein [Homoserinibacter sp. YIM 151385]|uniref:glycine betaine ABC transporter substrate-binding protein n=1 Tax=Homoserinibacter sp. YIM 151385 TaxID=2985506 RepID=UPI0022F09119|nr:glycine betaine ABC transporter substrate-binding protein [Homoserinibacter sp. YIM 151385]WBU39107.1 glycine betaine ABC transporter substrate-binding protein [Homoserinibacter sp. YIM 151385]